MKKERINSLKRFIRFLIGDIIWLLKTYGKLKEKLRDDGIYEVKPFKFASWHSGFNYFTGIANGNKVFIKTCVGKYNTIVTEVELNKFSNIDYIPKIVAFSLEEIPYVATEFIESATGFVDLKSDEKKLVISSSCEILDSLFCNGIIHRDIRPENLMLTNDQRLLLFDFGWAVFKSKGYKKSNYEFIEKILNIEYRNEMNEFDDAYAMYKSLKVLFREDKTIDLEDVRKRIGRYVL